MQSAADLRSMSDDSLSAAMEASLRWEEERQKAERASLASLPIANLPVIFGGHARALLSESLGKACQLHLCVPQVVFYHYGVHSEADFGWGCSYRCAQMLASCASDSSNVAAVREIQAQLGRIGAIPESDVGTHRWIEPSHVSQYLASLGLGMGQEVFEYAVGSSSDMQRLRSSLLLHFDAEHPLPVMVDDYTYSYIIAGGALVDEEMSVLCFDPHFTKPYTFDDVQRSVKAHLDGAALPTQLCSCNTGEDMHPVGWKSFRKHFGLDGPRQAYRKWSVFWPSSPA
jgi:hypothetical protein